MPAKPPRPTRPSLLFHACPETHADLLHFGRFETPDPFVAFSIGSRRIAVANDLEYARAVRESRFDEVLSLTTWMKTLSTRGRTPGVADLVQALARAYGVRSFLVSPDFPAGLYQELKRRRVPVAISKSPLVAERERKTPEEQEAIRRGNRASAAGFRAVEAILRESTIHGKQLRYRGKPLTSERLHEAIHIACIQAGALSLHCIAAGGVQACDPHCEGHGPLRANELIIVDIFPRMRDSGYFGDMTRTYLKGKAHPEQRRLVATVRKAQQLALGKIKAGVAGRGVHQAVVDYFTAQGYTTRFEDGVHKGFFHGLGHGLGLEVHEAPSLGRRPGRLRSGHVVTVEPGLYYPEIGGCRIEDVVAVTAGGCELLSRHPYRWEIP